MSEIAASIVNPRPRIGPHKLQHKNNGKKSALNSRISLHTPRKKSWKKADKVQKKKKSESRVRIKSSQNLSEIAVSTLNSIWKIYPHYFLDFKMTKFFLSLKEIVLETL